MMNAKTYGLTHLSLAVKDVEVTMAFYVKVFDMTVMYHEKGFLQLNTPGCHDVLVFEEKKDKPIGQTGGMAHFGFRLRNKEDIDSIINKVLSAGGKILDQGEFVPGSPYVFFKDPEGYDVEVWYELVKE